MNDQDPFEHHTVDVDGVRLHYVTAGSGPVVMLVHGWPQTWYEWRRVMTLLAQEHTVIAPDIRGMGYSGKPVSGYDATTIANELDGLLEHLGVQSCVVVGHDWGAAFSYVLAALHPSRVSALGIFEMILPGLGIMEQAMTPRPGGNYLWHMGFQSVPDVAELLIRGNEKAYLRLFFDRYAYDPTAISADDVEVYVTAMMQIGSLRAGLGVYQEFFTTADQIAALAKDPLTIPVRAFGGSASAGDMTLGSVRMVAPAAEGGIIDRCGHWAAEEQPAFVARVVRELVELSRSSAKLES